MKDLLSSISNNDLVLITVLMSVVALVLAIAISIEVLKNFFKSRKNKNLKTDFNTINIKEVEGINYVDEDEEIEKTNAKIELALLKERLKNEELEKKRLMELNLELAKKRNNEETIENERTQSLKEETTNTESIVNNINNTSKIDNVDNIDNDNNSSFLDATSVIHTENEIIEEQKSRDILDDEESAIISFDELKTTPNTSLLEDGTVKYEDEDTAVISITELEKLYNESLNINVVKEEEKKQVELMDFDIKRVKDLPEIKDYNDFQNTPFISPVHGLSQTENDIILTSTANLERLNKEIKKTNEFLQALKVLKKNLE